MQALPRSRFSNSLYCVILVLLFNLIFFDVSNYSYKFTQNENVRLLYLFHFILQGDYTRTGEIRFAGMMKDGVNSANRLLTFFTRNIVSEVDLTYKWI